MPPLKLLDQRQAATAGWWAVMAVALLARLAVCWRFGGQLDVDRDLYLEIAEHLARGDGFLHPYAGHHSAYRPMLYPYLLTAVLPLGRFGIGLLNLLLGITTVALTMSCGRRLGLGHWSLIAGLLTALDPLLLQGTVQVMTESLAAMLAMALMFTLIPRPSTPFAQFETKCFSPDFTFRDAWQELRLPISPYIWALVQGEILGLCCLSRPTFWAFAVLWCGLVVLLWTWMHVRAPRSKDAPHDSVMLSNLSGWRSAALYALLFGTALVATQLPWVCRNLTQMKSFILTTTHGGYTLLLGHNPTYYREVVEQPWGTVWPGSSLTQWQAELEQKLSAQQPPLDFGRGPTVEVARDRWMSQAAWREIRSDPAMAVRSGLTLLGRFWSLTPQAGGTDLPRVFRWAIGAWYAVVFVAAIAGLVRVTATRDVAWMPLVLLIVSFTLVHSLYWADMRMRAPLSPILALLAAAWCSCRR